MGVNPTCNRDLEAIAADIVSRLGGRWKQGGAMCRCPAHDDRAPSLSVRVGDRALLFKCFAGCDTRDVIRAILRLHPYAIDRVEARHHDNPHGSGEFWSRRIALNLWDQSRPLIGTLGEIYLRRRSLACLSPALRFNARTPLGRGAESEIRPAMIAAIHDAGRFVAIQRTFLDSEAPCRARDLENPRLILGRPRRGAVVLAPARVRLGLAEGIETALSAMALFDLPVWATLGNKRFDQIALPASVGHLILFPDNDRGGEIGAAAAARAYASAERKVETIWPPDRFNDWNDVLREGR
jgi:putative DNA primase/helicase